VDHGADVINMSLGGGKLFYDGSSTEEDAIRYALAKGVVLIASAGNDGAGANRKNFPAAYPGVIAVGAVDRRMQVWPDSNRHSYVAVCAPGVDIVSADASGGYVVGTGTSPSSAIVAGVAALIRARYPRLTPQEVRQALVQGSVPRSRPPGVTTCSTTLDAVRAMAVAARINRASQGQDATPTPSPEPVQADDVPDERSSLMLPAVLVGGGVLIAIGVVLGWVQRRRPEEDEVEGDSPYEVMRPEYPPRRVGAMPADDPAGIAVAPVNAPLWQSTEVFPGGQPHTAHPAWPPPPSERHAGQSEQPGPSHAPDPAQRPGGLDGGPLHTPVPEADPHPDPEPEHGWRLRPFVPEEFLGDQYGGGAGITLNGFNGLDGVGFNGLDGVDGASGANGSGATRAEPPEGHRINGLNGSRGATETADAPEEPPLSDDEPVIDDEEWERFRRSVLGDAPSPADGPSAPPRDDAPEARPDNTTDELPAVAFPSAPPPDLDDTSPPPGAFPPPASDDDPPGGFSHRRRPNDEDDYRPPWW